MPSTRLVDTVKILSKLTALYKSVHFNARTRRSVGTASWQDKFIWVVDLEYDETHTKLEVRGEGHTFDEALQAAWTKFEVVCQKGVGYQALTPPVEQKALVGPASAEPTAPPVGS